MEKKDEVWQVVSSKYLFRRPWLTVRCDDMLLPNGNHIPEYYILEYPDWVNTIAITKEGKFVFVRQFRPGIGKQLYELCAGVCEKEDASPLVSAQAFHSMKWLPVSTRSALESASTSSASVKRSLQKCTVFDEGEGKDYDYTSGSKRD